MPSTLTYPGVYIEELPSGVHTIVGAATSITAFIGTAPRGPVNQATTIGGFADYERTFGGLDKKNPMGFAVRDFFLNGGSQAVIVRLYHSPDTTKDSTKLPIGRMALIAANPGTWGKNLRAIVDRNVTDEAARMLGLSDASKLFNLTVLEDVPNGLIERFANLSVEESPRRIDKVLKAQSKLAQWDGTLDPTQPPDIPGNNPTKATKDFRVAQAALATALQTQAGATDAEKPAAAKAVTDAQTDLAAKRAALEQTVGDPVTEKQKVVDQATANLSKATSKADIDKARTALDQANNDRETAKNNLLGLDSNALTLIDDFVPDGAEADKVGLFALEQVDLFNLCW